MHRRKNHMLVSGANAVLPDKNGGHHWPGAKFNAALFTSLKLGNFCRDVNANDLIRDSILAIEGN
jgi:hypothetical protein